jgi:hypothetical protein
LQDTPLKSETFCWKKMKKVSKPAFDFVLEYLDRLHPIARPMFGCHAVYVNDKIVLITRDKGTDDGDEGVWIATRSEHHSSLRQELPSLRSIGVLGNGVTQWQVIPKTSPTFEEEVVCACDLILRRDARIGSTPKKRKENPKRPTRKR